ncbi:hypothetical protein PInf_024570 [Phytophthora infestans]|nr:hypothetical protein PInf_024570 [Phytophthora infestans]
MASSNSSGLEQEVTAPTNVSTSGDSCTWYAGESCEKSRTCYDCLNVGVVGDSEEYAAKGGDKSSTVCIGQNGCPSFEKAKVGSIMLVIAMGWRRSSSSRCSLLHQKAAQASITLARATSTDPSVLSRGRPQRPPRGPQLSLSGWKSMREKLIETEKDNETSSAGAAGVMRIQLSAREDTSSVIIEEGEGYRPGSPSEQYQTHRREDISSEPFTLSQ